MFLLTYYTLVTKNLSSEQKQYRIRTVLSIKYIDRVQDKIRVEMQERTVYNYLVFSNKREDVGLNCGKTIRCKVKPCVRPL
jgi:hypothetical protein